MLYNIQNPMDRAQQMTGQASSITGSMDKRTKIIPPDKTVGGGMMNAAGGGMTGIAAANALGMASSAGTFGIGGLILGLGAYLMS